MKKILLLKVGHTFEEIARLRGDYDAWFRERLGVSDGELEVVRLYLGAPLPRQFDYDGVVVSGSFAMVTDRADWSVATADYLREAVSRDLPTLGVCYGHQLLADAFGGEVGDNPRGRAAGSVTLDLTDAAANDPLFRGLPSPLSVHVSHRQSVLALPAGATLLGSSAHDPHHAFRLGERTWGVQFHPEFDAAIARGYIEARRDIFVREGHDPEAMLAAVEETEHGAQLLQRFSALLG